MTYTTVDKTSPMPLYLQLAEILQRHIDSGELAQGDPLPSERVLRETYDVSRSTVREAVLHLKQKGIVETRRGSGNFVKVIPTVDRDLLGIHDFDVQIEQGGHSNQVQILHFTKEHHSSRVSQLLQVESDVPLIKVTRLRLADGEPLFIEKIYLSSARFPRMTQEDFSNTQVFTKKIIQVYGMDIDEVVIQLEPILLNRKEIENLGVKRHPAAGLLNERTTYNKRGEPIVFSKWVFSSNRCRHMLKIKAK
ncbi:GntR family transcriptional regulator [Halomonas sp.]|uniref:GntR family transcriptional regulator n=1 Tax=Halomonas sp. TaxID=1486246 RepID=UPI003D0A459D